MSRPTAVLLGLAVAFVAALAWQRSRSAVLAAAAERELAARVAAASGLAGDEVMALRVLAGADLDEPALGELARALRAARADFGPRLAILAVGGHRDLAVELLAASGGDVAAAEALLRGRPEDVVASRFHALVERFGMLR